MVQQGARLSLLAEAPKARRPAVMGATAFFKFVKIQYIYRPMPSPSLISHYLYIVTTSLASVPVQGTGIC